jgi:3-phenylpropionate/trans-cinnamate dioxygenase ferredoxin reductase component
VRLDSGVTIDCDLVLATGVTPQSRLAADAGLQIRDSRIVVSPDMGASAPDVYAASDLALAWHERGSSLGHRTLDATDQGEITGAAAAGQGTK